MRSLGARRPSLRVCVSRLFMTICILLGTFYRAEERLQMEYPDIRAPCTEELHDLIGEVLEDGFGHVDLFIGNRLTVVS
jgi:hypothetical protein